MIQIEYKQGFILKAKKLTQIGLFNLLIIISLLAVQASISQSIDNFGGKYTAKVGDTAQYQFSNLKNQSKNFLIWNIFTPQRTLEPVRLSDGIVFTVKINKINNSNVIYQSIFTLHNETKILGNFGLGISYIGLVFQSKQNAISYYTQNYFKAVGGVNWTYIVDNNYVYFTGIYSHDNLIIQSKYNWHTGWLSTYNFTLYGSEFSVATRLYFSKYEGLFPKIIQNTPLLVGVPIIVIVTISVVIVGFNYKKYSKINKEATLKTYLREKTNIKGKNKKNPSNINTDKALQTIDEIINESQKSE